MRTIATVILLALSCTLAAQRECASATYIDRVKTSGSTTQGMAEAERFLQQQLFKNPLSIYAKTAEGAASSIIRIPVVVHVLYQNAAQNISEAQVKSQIDALNRDFRKKNSDTAKTPVYFKSLAADVEIEFVLATADPKGRPTNGIVRKQTAVSDWVMDDKIKQSAQGGSDAWDSKSYLNIWVGNMRNLLGYSSTPGGDVRLDGIVISTAAFGTINTAAPFHLGRTAVHEVGHWLGLRHIWGDAACGDDLVEDTPRQGSFTSGCPTGVFSSCSNANGDMYMNYMDFTDDACLNLFTNGQKNRMRALFTEGGPRNSLLASKGLFEPWLEEAMVVEETVMNTASMKLYPNPAVAEVVLNFNGDDSWIGQEVRLLNINGVTLQRVMISAKTQKISLAQLQPGIYFIQATNGTKKLIEKLVKL